MIDYRTRPKGFYIQEATWQDLYKLTEHWKNSLEFYQFEIQFLRRLIDTYFINLLVQFNLDELRELQIDLFQAENKSNALLQQIKTHMNHIIEIFDQPFKYDASICRTENECLEDEVAEFIKMQKVFKVVVYKMTKDILESEKPKFIWKYN